MYIYTQISLKCSYDYTYFIYIYISLKFQYYNQCQHTFSCLQMSLSRRKVTQYLECRWKHILLMLCCTDTVLLTDCTSLHTLSTAAIGAPRLNQKFCYILITASIDAICSAVCSLLKVEK